MSEPKPEMLRARVPADLLAKLKRKLRPGETVSELVRAAVEAELRRRRYRVPLREGAHE